MNRVYKKAINIFKDYEMKERPTLSFILELAIYRQVKPPSVAA